MQAIPYVLALVGAAVVSAAVALFAWRRHPAPGAWPLALMMLAAAEWSLTYALELGSAGLSTKAFWVRVEYPGIVAVSVTWAIFALQYTGREKWLRRRVLLSMWAVPLVTLSMAWTNSLHGLMWKDFRLDSGGPFPVLHITYGAWWYVHTTYSYLTFLLGTLLLLWVLVRSPHLYRGQTGALLIAALMPWAGNMAYLLGWGPFPHLDLTPFAFTLSGLLIAWAFFRFRLLDILPVVRDAVVESMNDGVIVIDTQNRIVDLNPAARRILGPMPAGIIGQPAAQLFVAQPTLAERLCDETETHMEIVLGEAQRSYDLRISPLYGWRGRLAGRLVALRDVTERVQVEAMLRQRNRDLELLNRSVQAFISTLALDDVLAAVLEEVRRLLDVTGCSIWLIVPETGELVCQQAAGPQSEIVRGWRLAPEEGFASWVVRSGGKSLIVADAWTDKRYSKGVERQTGLLLRSILSAPLQAKQGVIGVLQVVDTQVNRFTEADQTLVESLASAAATAIENARLYEAAKELHRQTQRDAETRAMLLREVNHRVKNNLTAILGLLSIERRHAVAEHSPAYHALVDNLANRIKSLAQVHSLLSAIEWQPLSLSDLARQIIHTALQSLPGGETVSVSVTPSLAQVTPDQAHNLAMIINELTTNTLKHAVPEQGGAQIAVRIMSHDGLIQCEFRDDGPGYSPEVLRLEHRNVGLYLIQNLVQKGLHGEIELHNDRGAVTIIRFKALTPLKEPLLTAKNAVTAEKSNDDAANSAFSAVKSTSLPAESAVAREGGEGNEQR
jgi:PAS domain S-box-containing protein